MNLLNKASPAGSSFPSLSTRTTPLRSSTVILLISSLLWSNPSEERKPTARYFKFTGEQSRVTSSRLFKTMVRGDSLATISSMLLLLVSVSFSTATFSVSLSILFYPNIISSSDAATVNDPGDSPLLGHDALSYFLADGA